MFVVKARANFNYFVRENRTFGASWNVQWPSVQAIEAMAPVTAWSSFKDNAKDQSASDAAPIILETWKKKLSGRSKPTRTYIL